MSSVIQGRYFWKSVATKTEFSLWQSPSTLAIPTREATTFS